MAHPARDGSNDFNDKDMQRKTTTMTDLSGTDNEQISSWG